MDKKRLTIASVLTANPKLIILDEPTAGQDYYHYKQFMSFIRKLAKKGISFIFITHDMNLALEYADRAIVLHEGRIIANHTASIVLGHPATLQRANLKESSLFKLVKFSGIANPENLWNFILMILGGRKVYNTYFYRMDGAVKLLLFIFV